MRVFQTHCLRLALCLAMFGAASGARAEPASPQESPAVAESTSTTPQDSIQQWIDRHHMAEHVSQVSSRASDLVLTAMSFIGVRYRYGGNNAATGFDCSGFVRHVYETTLGMALPHNAKQQSREGEKVAEDALRPGDLVFFHTLRRAFSHVGIYIGNGQFIHSPRPGERVQVENMDAPYWARRFDGARRLIRRAADDLVPTAEAAVPEDAIQAAPAAVESAERPLPH